MNRTAYFVRLFLAVFLVVVILAPITMMFATSLKADEQQILIDFGNWRAFFVSPSEMSLENYRQVLSDEQAPFLRFLFNSAFITAIIVIIGVFVNSAVAFSLSRLTFPGRKFILGVFVALIIIPLEALAVPLLLMMNKINWLDTYQVQIIPFIAHPFSIFLFYQFFEKLPRDLDDAAYVEGASPWRVYWDLALPLSLPVVATVVILQSLEVWNSYLWPLMVTRGPDVRPVSLALAQFFGTPPPVWGDLMAFSVMMSLPVLIVYLGFQRWFIQSAVNAAVKG
ncbi:MAG: carbohydrate ABC transporter permease [Granulosicoccus sp.]|nr:carbohydrate ABC transporter permease [Granulosicoccus sp.]